jgi:hypothetical protein
MEPGSPRGLAESGRQQSRSGQPASPTGPKILRKKESKMAMIDKVKDELSNVANKVSIENFTDAISSLGQDRVKFRETKAVATAPPGVVQSYSVVLTHVIAPLWSVNGKPCGVSTPISFAQQEIQALGAAMDKRGLEVEFHLDALKEPTLATAYITILVTKLLTIEQVDYARSSFTDVVAQIARDVRYKNEYEEHLNDETVAHDQPKRKLQEVGGSWKRACAIDLNYHGDQIRRKCLYNLFLASISFNYVYTDENLHFMCDALSSQLFLVNYSESLVALIAGHKGPQYVAKWLLHLSPAQEELVLQDCIVAPCTINSLYLTEINKLAYLAVSNFIHRNDTSDTLCVALTKAIAFAPQTSLPSLFTFANRILHRIYMCDLSLIVSLIDAVRPFVVFQAPVGTLAVELLNDLLSALRNVNCLQRRMCCTLFVAGAEMRSFRRRPAHLITAPYCSRSFVIQRLFNQNIDMQRGGNPHYPTALEQGLDPATGQPLGVPLDDVVLYVANQVTNIFQSIYELCQGNESVQQHAGTIDLAQLFSVPPYALCPYFPSVLQFISQEKNFITDGSNTTPEALTKVTELYLTILDHNKPVRGQRRFRLESPRPPMVPITMTVSTEQEDMNEVIKATIDKHWRYCDQRILEKEIAALHPKKELSLSHFIESYISLLVAGGGGMIRRVVTAILHMRAMYPGAVPQFRFYVLPCGYCNDLAAWICRSDPLYKHQVFDPIVALTQKSVDLPTVDALNAQVPLSHESRMLRQTVNDYLLDATVPNEIIVYQVEGQLADGTVLYIPFLSHVEIGIHVHQAGLTEDAVRTQHEGVSLNTFCNDGTKKDRSLAKQGSLSGITKPPQPGVKPGAGMPLPPQAQLPGASQLLPTAAKYIVIGEHKDSLEKIKVRLHGQRGLPLSTKKHPADPGDVRHVANGVEVLDWISTTFHQYEPGAATQAAQSLLDNKLLICVATPLGKDASKFNEGSLYTIVPREPNDEEPLVIPSNRNNCFEAAMGIKNFIESTPNFTTNVPLRVRASFVGMQSDLTYIDLRESSSTFRDVITLKIKATGSPGDIGSLPDPTIPMLQMTIHEIEKKRPIRARELVDQNEHYQLRFGEGKKIDPKSVLSLDLKTPTHCLVDGDAFGPFTALKVRPILNQQPVTKTRSATVGPASPPRGGNQNPPSTPGGMAPAVDADSNVCTITVMSFLRAGGFY